LLIQSKLFLSYHILKLLTGTTGRINPRSKKYYLGLLYLSPNAKQLSNFYNSCS